jgi:RNA polymerase sigma-70 factor (ECF subfamily)
MVTTIHPGPTDVELMTRIQQHDDRALEVMVDRYQALLNNIAFQLLYDSMGAAAVVNETFLNLWQHADRYNAARGQAIGWLITVVRRRSIDHARRQRRITRIEEREKQFNDAAFADDDVIESTQRHEDQRRVEAMLSTLPDNQRVAVRMSYLDGLTQREIAARTGTPLGTIKTRIELGVKKLRCLSMSPIIESIIDVKPKRFPPYVEA